MVARKPTKTGTEVANWDEELARRAELAHKTEESVSLGQFVSLKSGVLSFNGMPFPDNEMDVIVIDHIMAYTFYVGRYDPDNPTSPVCYAFGREEGEMRPHEKSESPQDPACKGCPNNEFNSADTGKGKACKNSRRLALITGESLEDVGDAQVVYLNVPVTSVRGWAQYVDTLFKTLRKPPFAVITRIKVVPDPKTQFKLNFSLVEEVNGENFAALIAKQDLVAQSIAFPYSENSARTSPAATNAKGGRQAPGKTQAKPATRQRKF